MRRLHKIVREKKTRLEKINERKKKLEDSLHGSGEYIFRNNHKGDYTLTKTSLDGKKSIPPKGEFKGDSYFLRFVKSHDLTLVSVLKEESKIETNEEVIEINESIINKEEEGKPMNEEKLILDQPEMITEEGVVEHVAVERPSVDTKKKEFFNKKKLENVKNKKALINEDPAGSIEVIND